MLFTFITQIAFKLGLCNVLAAHNLHTCFVTSLGKLTHFGAQTFTNAAAIFHKVTCNMYKEQTPHPPPIMTSDRW